MLKIIRLSTLTILAATLVICLILLVTAIGNYRIPSGAMVPTLLVGDFILVNKFHYGLRLPITHIKISDGEKPKHGDVIVFRYPEDESILYVKRVIGLPGDRIKYYGRRLTINDRPVSIVFDHKYKGLGTRENMMKKGGCDKVNAACDVYGENIDQLEYNVMTDPDVRYSFDGEILVPEGQYFVMGDNRDHSNDSRFWGFVPEKNLVGKALMIWMHWDWREDGSGLDIFRIGQSISN